MSYAMILHLKADKLVTSGCQSHLFKVF